MADRPILFSGPMVRALLDGRKSQTRRILSSDKPNSLFNGKWADSYVLDPGNAEWRDNDVRYAVGDRLWVRETLKRDDDEAWRFAADGKPITMSYDDPRVPHMIAWAHHKEAGTCVSIHMPRWASRLTLIVTDVRVQRFQEISEEDAIAEGAHPCGVLPEFGGMPMWGIDGEQLGNTPVAAFSFYWDRLNGRRGFGWDANPWVVALTFDVIQQNIDQIERAA